MSAKEIPTKRISAFIEYEIDADDYYGEAAEEENIVDLLLTNIGVYDIRVGIETVIDETFTIDSDLEA